MPQRTFDITLQNKSGTVVGEYMLAKRSEREGGGRAWVEQRAEPFNQGFRTKGVSLEDRNPLEDITFAQHDWQGGALHSVWSDSVPDGYMDSSWDMLWPHLCFPGIPRNYGSGRGNGGAPIGLMIHNPYFEINDQATIGWLSFGGPTSADFYSTTDPRTTLFGTHHARVVTGAATRGMEYRISFVNAMRNTSFTFAAYVKKVSGSGNVYLRIDDGIGTTDSSTTTSSTYTLLTVTRSLDAAATQLHVRILGSDSNTFDVDDVAVYFTNAEPTRIVHFKDNTYQAFGAAVCKLNTGTTDELRWDVVDVGTAQCTDLAWYKDRIYAAYGGSTAYRYSQDATTWTAAAGGAGADNYAIRFGVSRNMLWKAQTHAAIRSSTTDPETGAAWSSSYTVGSVNSEINRLYDFIDTLWVGKEDGLWSFLAYYEDGSAANFFINQTPEFATNPNTVNFSRGTVHDKQLFLKSGVVGLRAVDGFRDVDLSDLITRPCCEVKGQVRALTGFWDRAFLFIDDKLLAMKKRAGSESYVLHTMKAPLLSTSVTAQTPTASANTAAIYGSATDQGASSWSDGRPTQAWTDPANAGADDDVRATMSLLPGYKSTDLLTSSYGLAVPTNATIVGVKFVVNGSVLNDGSAAQVQCRVIPAVGGVQYGSYQEATLAIDNSDQAHNFGGSSDLWGRSEWTPAGVNASNFGAYVGIYHAGGGVTTNVRIDSISVQVYYTLPPTQADGIYVREAEVVPWSSKPNLLATTYGVDTGGLAVAFTDVWALPHSSALASDVLATPVLLTSAWDGGLPLMPKVLDYIEVLLKDMSVGQSITISYGVDGADATTKTLGTISNTNANVSAIYSYGVSNYENEVTGRSFQFAFTGSGITTAKIDGFVVHFRAVPRRTREWELTVVVGRAATNSGLPSPTELPAEISKLLALESTGTALTMKEDLDGDGIDTTYYAQIVPGSVRRAEHRRFVLGSGQEAWEVKLREVKVSD